MFVVGDGMRVDRLPSSYAFWTSGTKSADWRSTRGAPAPSGSLSRLPSIPQERAFLLTGRSRCAGKVPITVTCRRNRRRAAKLLKTPFFMHYDIDLGSSFGRITSVLPTILKLSVRY